VKKVEAMPPSLKTQPLLSVTRLCKHFTIHTRGGKKIEGFSEATFNVPEGSVLALSGPSGIGKSSVLKCIYRTYLPSAGSVVYRSRMYGRVDLTALSEYRILQLRASEIGYATQFLKVLPRVPALDVVAEPLLDGETLPERARAEARQILDQLNIPETLFDAYPVTFSGGEQQRINLARAIIARPRLLLLDEPIASLDEASIDIVIKLLGELRDRGTTMVIVSHNSKILESLADQVYRLPTKPDMIIPCESDRMIAGA
jgi:alpha-D-ribose 1-methylphosphonate 5-triphosphate synthase subunit PhnL